MPHAISSPILITVRLVLLRIHILLTIAHFIPVEHHEKTDIPTRKLVPFGVNGPRRNLTDKTPVGSNQASYDAGCPPVTMTIKAAGGLPPDGRDINQAFNELYSDLRWQNAGAGWPFDAD